MRRQLIWFALAGGLATALHYALLISLVERGMTPVPATSLGALAGAAVNYLINRRYTFRSARAHREAVPRYLITAASGMAINGGVVGAAIAMSWHYLAAQVAATALVFIWNFVVNRRWTFRGEGYAQ